MMSHARASVVLTAATAGLSFACADPTLPPAPDQSLTPPVASGDLSALAGTYVETRDAGVRYILGAGGTFIYRIELSDRVSESSGTWYRAESTVALRFDRGGFFGGWNASARVRGDTLLFDPSVDAEWVGFVGGRFVRVRQP